jgi:hypothetical protein
MTCKYCKESNMSGSCAFPTEGWFHKDNWNCATMNAFRDFICNSAHAYHDLVVGYSRDDLSAASIGVIRIPEKCVLDDGSGLLKGGGYLCIAWYKDRGRTSSAIRVWNEEISTLTFDVADRLIQYIRK